MRPAFRLRPIAGVLATLFLQAPIAVAQTPAIDFDQLQAEAVVRLSEYIRINTTNPPGNELQTALWLKEVLAKEGIEGQILDTAELGPGRANFYARLKGSGSKKALALVHHMDVVPVTQKDWTVDAFGGTVKDGYVWGRGTIDMKGHGIVQLMAMIAIKRAGIVLDREIVYIGNADEEVNGDGAIAFTRNHKDLIADVEYLLTEAENNGMEQGRLHWFGVDVGEKRLMWLRLIATGRTSHGSLPIPGQNPVPKITGAVTRVAAWQTPVRLTPAVDRFFRAQAPFQVGEGQRWMADPAAALKDPKGRAWLLSSPERNALLRNTIAPTVLTGSNATNTIPQVATAELDIRLLPDEDLDAFRQELVRRIADSTIRLEPVIDIPPPYSAPINSSLVRAVERVIGQLLPGVAVTTPISIGATDRPYWAAAGITCYGIQPFLVNIEDNRYMFHGNDERVSVENVGFGVRFYVGLLQQMN